MTEKEKKQKRAKKSTGLGLAVWLLAFLIILIVFLVKQEEIKTNLKTSQFFEKITGKTPAFIENHPVEKDPVEDESKITLNVKETKSPVQIVKEKIEEKKPAKTETKETPVPAEPATKLQQKTIENDISKIVEEKKNQVLEATKTEAKEIVKTVIENKVEIPKITKQVAAEKEATKVEKDQEKIPETIQSRICFVHYDADGLVIRKEVVRNVEKDSPLTNSINSLLKGPSSGEISKGCMTMIPEGTRLYSASVKNGIATLNFSEELEFQPRGGIEAQIGKLMQIVYTATNYSTVKGVQILIEGKKKEYLGSEGIWIGSPLTRASF